MIAEFRPRDTIDELKQRVDIDWKADPKTLAKAEFKQTGPPFRVIWLRKGKSTHYAGKEPNDMVLEYLKWKDKETNVTEQEGRDEPPLCVSVADLPGEFGSLWTLASARCRRRSLTVNVRCDMRSHKLLLSVVWS